MNDNEGADDQPKGASNKPIASHLIPGTPWCVVWTGDEKVFYFNPTTKISVWEKPEELADNDQVDEVLEAGPEKKATSKGWHNVFKPHIDNEVAFDIFS